jgi:D-3-phosphoglycerate dehydrogenase
VTARRPKVLLTAPIEPVGEEALSRFADMVVSPRRDQDLIRTLARDVDGIIACSPVPADIFDHAPRLRAIVRHGAGYDAIPAREAIERGIGVAYVPGANAQSVAEHAVGAMLELARRYRFLDRDLRRDGWNAARSSGWKPLELAGKRLGIVGVGAIGGRIAHIAGTGLGMQVSGYQRRTLATPSFVRAVALDDLFATSDVLVLACPLSDETARMVNARSLGRMKPSAFLINISRGGLVDEEALADALLGHRLAGAALDVFVEEPLPADHPFLGIEAMLLTPHQAGASVESRTRISVIAVSEMERLLAGRPAEHPVRF